MSHSPDRITSAYEQVQKDMSSISQSQMIGALTVLLLVVGVSAGVMMGQGTGDTRSDASEVETGVQQNTAVQPPTKQTIEPWAYADDFITPEPAILSAQEYNELYRQVREAITQRDYDLYKSVASEQRGWLIDHSYKYTSGAADGSMRAIFRDVPGSENFRLNAVSGILSQGLPLDLATAKTVTQRNPVLTTNTIELLSNKDNSTTVLNMTPWRYIVDISYTSNSKSPDDATGTVTFVYDKNQWKYLGELWKVTPHKSALQFGDKADAVVSFDMSSPSGFIPSVDIQSGESVTWKNMSGMVYSTAPDTDPWNSYYLYNDTYTKTFTEAGRHQYTIHYFRDGVVQTFEGVINVK